METVEIEKAMVMKGNNEMMERGGERARCRMASCSLVRTKLVGNCDSGRSFLAAIRCREASTCPLDRRSLHMSRSSEYASYASLLPHSSPSQR